MDKWKVDEDLWLKEIQEKETKKRERLKIYAFEQKKKNRCLAVGCLCAVTQSLCFYFLAMKFKLIECLK